VDCEFNSRFQARVDNSSTRVAVRKAPLVGALISCLRMAFFTFDGQVRFAISAVNGSLEMLVYSQSQKTMFFPHSGTASKPHSPHDSTYYASPQ
jgi:hypothetical protein